MKQVKSSLISGRIIEYDIASANITMLRKYNKITDEYYQYLSRLPKISREIEVGKLIATDSTYYQAIHNGILEARNTLIELNNISADEIVRIANDAIYVNRFEDLGCTEFDGTRFAKKGEYKSMLSLMGNLIILVSSSADSNGNINVDVKGINDSLICWHEKLLTFIVSVINMIENSTEADTMRYITQFCDLYIKRDLPIDFYRELNPQSAYRLENSNFLVTYLPEEEKDTVDINWNLRLIRELYGIALEKFSKTVVGGA